MSRKQTARIFSGGFIFLSLMFLAGCAGWQSERLRATADAFPEPVELTAVPFFPQEEFQCGPAALGMALAWSGVAITPAQLAPQVYLPERRGSLQLELIGAARRHGRIPYVLQPQLESLLAEVASGHPVVVLQNLSLSWYPVWHYAVVVGFDLPRDQIVLRSGKDERRLLPFKLFERTWRRADYWAMVVLPPERLPFTAEEIPYVQAVAPLERLGHWQETAAAYSSALARWPKSLAARMGLGNSRYALGDKPGAEQAFRRATVDHPESGAALNNLAQTLADLDRLPEARAAAGRAVELGGPQSDVFRETLRQIEAKIEVKS